MDRAFGGIVALVCALVCCAVVGPGRASAETFFVNSTSDTDTASADAPALAAQCENVQAGDIGPADNTTCTLRGALDAVTATGGSNTIEFWTCGPYNVSAQLPAVPADTTLDGGAALNDGNDVANEGCQEEYYQWYYDSDPATYNAQNPTCPEAADDPWYPDCESTNYGFAHIEGPGGNDAFPGLVLTGGGSTIKSMMLGGFSDAVVFAPPGNDTLEDSGVGNDGFEQGPLNPQNTGNGVEVQSGSANDVIGYSLAADGSNAAGDDIYGNLGWGVYLEKGSGPTVMGDNFIGTDTSGHQYAVDGPQPTDNPPDGTPVIDGNGLGGVYDDGTGDLIGGDTACKTYYDVCTSNIVAGNQGPGIEFGPDASQDHAASDYIGESVNFYGTNYDGVAIDNGPLANGQAGVIDQGTGDVIGGTGTAAANQISGNAGPGVELEGSGSSVEDNLIGLNFAGTGIDANQGAGVLATDAGGVTSGSNRVVANTIGGNTGAGVELDQGNDFVLGNYIGFTGNHNAAAANAIGVLAKRGPQEIGAPTSAINTIANNTGAGIAVVDPSAGTYVGGVEIYDNSIRDNGGLGIDLGNDGPTPNHVPDTTPGPNGFTNYPVLTSASQANGQWSIHGTLTALPSTYYTIEVFGNQACDPSGYGQGQTLVAGGALTTSATGQGSFAISGSGPLPPVLSAFSANTPQGTSEFGPCLNVGGGVSLSATQTATGKVIAGDDVDVDVHIANAGPADATNTLMTLTVPDDVSIASQPAGCPAPVSGTFTCNLGTIASGSSLDAHVLLQPQDGAQTLTDTVTLGADQVQLNGTESDLATSVAPNPSAPTNVYRSIAEPTPTYEEFLRLDRESGTVTATLPNGQHIDLSNYALIPSGTLVSAVNGVARVTAQVRSRKATSYIDLKYGSFEIHQAHGFGGLVSADMNGSLAGCPASVTSTDRSVKVTHDALTYGTALTLADELGAKKAPAKKHKKPTTRRLWGHDSGGKFQIRGNRGAATVQGTEWEVTDTCTTTTVRVYRDSVQVTGIGNSVPKSATVTAGHAVVLRKG